VCLASFTALGLYWRVWRWASVEDLARCSLAATAAVAAGTILSFLLNPMTPPLSWFVTCYLLVLFGLNGTRASYRLLQESWKRLRADGEPVIIYGAGRVGTSAVRELLSKPDARMRPLGFIDDQPDLAGKVFQGYPVFGSLEALPSVIAARGIKAVIVATSKLRPDRQQTVALLCERSGIPLRYFQVGFEERRTGQEPTALIATRQRRSPRLQRTALAAGSVSSDRR
jgi:FlaA1/EpsC-like NDP-sugar epimerase